MSRRLLLFAALLSGVPSLLVAAAGEKPPPARPLALSLEAVRQEMKAGTTPAFRLTLRDTSGETQRVPDIRKRPDPQDTYYDLSETAYSSSEAKFTVREEPTGRCGRVPPSVTSPAEPGSGG